MEDTLDSGKSLEEIYSTKEPDEKELVDLNVFEDLLDEQNDVRSHNAHGVVASEGQNKLHANSMDVYEETSAMESPSILEDEGFAKVVGTRDNVELSSTTIVVSTKEFDALLEKQLEDQSYSLRGIVVSKKLGEPHKVHTSTQQLEEQASNDS